MKVLLKQKLFLFKDYLRYINLDFIDLIYYLLILCAVVAVILLCRIIFKKVNVKDILITTLLPKPIFGPLTTKFINKIAGNTKVSAILSLREEIIKRFGSLGNIPVILDVYQKLSIDQIGQNPTTYENNQIKWCVNNKFATVFIKPENLAELLPMYYQIFEGISFQSVVFHFSDVIHELSSLCNLIFSITKTVVPVVLVYDAEFMHLQSLISIFKKEEYVGIDIKGDFNMLFEDFLHQCIERSLSDSVLIDKNFPKDLVFLRSIKEIIDLNIQKVKDSEMIIRGFYMIVTDKIDLKQDVFFVESLFDRKIYNLCNESKIIDQYKNVRKNRLIKTLVFASWIMTFLASLSISKKIKKQFDNIQMSVHMARNIKESKTINDVKILDNIKKTSNYKYSFLTQLLAKSEIEKISQIRKFLTDKSIDSLAIIGDISNAEIFYFSPTETKLFQQLQYNIDSLCCSLMNIYNFLNNENNIHRAEQKLVEYIKNSQEKIFSNFLFFAKSFERFALLDEQNKLEDAIHKMINSPSAESLSYLIAVTNNVKSVCASNNVLWISECKLSKPFNDLVDQVKKIPEIGHNLSVEIEKITEQELRSLKNKIMEKEILSLGKIFVHDGERLLLSPQIDKFVKNCQLFLKEEIIQLPKGELIYIKPDANEISLWNTDILDKILQKTELRSIFIKDLKNFDLETRQIGLNLADKSMVDYIKSTLCRAQKIVNDAVTIEEQSKNLSLAIDKIEKIRIFMQNSLNIELPYFVDFLIDDTIEKIADELRNILNKSNFTAYTKLDQWDGEDLVPFLFQCKNEDLPFLTSRTINYFLDLKEQVLSHILKKLSETNKNEYRFFKNIFNDISSYSNGQKNGLSSLESFINSLSSWEIKWRDPNIQNSVKDDFFTYHERAFRKNLILHTNRVLLKKSKAKYNKLVDFFNENLSGKYPFGTKNKANSVDIIQFLEMYKEYRDQFYSDKDFQKIPLYISLKNLDNLLNFFVVENDTLYINAKIQYHLPEGKNNYLIKHYTSKFGEEVISGDTVDYKTKAINGFSLGIQIISTSKMKIKNFRNEKFHLDTNLQINHIEEYGFIDFVKKFILRKTEKDAVLKIMIPISSDDGSINDEIICYINIINYPNFFTKMKHIQ